jgi:hypothetical protein
MLTLAIPTMLIGAVLGLRFKVIILFPGDRHWFGRHVRFGDGEQR